MSDNNFVSLVQILATPMQEAENAAWEVIDGLNVNDATGDQLSLLGKLVDQPREGITDDDLYRIFVRARIRANRSNGNGEDIYAVFELLVDDGDAHLWIRNTGVASFEIVVEDVVTPLGAPGAEDTAFIYTEFLGDIISAGVRAILEVWTAPGDEIATFGDGGDIYTPGADEAGIGDDRSGSDTDPPTVSDWRTP